jgi:hypothetical protein
MDNIDEAIKRLKVVYIMCLIFFAAAITVLVVFIIMILSGAMEFDFKRLIQLAIPVIPALIAGGQAQTIRRKIKILAAERAHREKLQSDDEPAEKERIEKFLTANSRPDVTVKKEIIEKTKVVTFMRCSHCGTKYDETLPACPNCGGE